MTDPLARLSTALGGRYRLERELGQGGMATVYLARDLRHDRDVALKVLRPELAAMLGAERFLGEIRTTANLQHPNILPLFDSGAADGFLWYAMPFVEGGTLRERLVRDRQLGVDDGLTIVDQMAAALDHAHARGVVHRDIKPENILFSSGQAMLADFGIARAIGAAGGDQLTATGMAVGTPAYMSPEQSVGQSDLDGRTDQYALASVLYEMLAGEPPFTGASAAAVLAKRMGTSSPSVRVVRDTVPEPLDLAIQRGMARAPADRFPTVAAFAAALRAAPGSRRARRPLVALAAGAFVVLAGLGIWAIQAQRLARDLDADVVAVLPFRVGGDGTAYLRESMLDLLHARLTGEAGPRTVEPRTMLSAWRQAVRSETEDLSEDDSRRLAVRLGAGRMLLGSAIATPTELTLSGSLVRVADGATLATGVVAGLPDSVAVLVNRLTARLLSQGAGESRERIDGLAATSLDALQDYLAGRAAYRNGDYHEAMDLYARAFGRDSTFAQAAFGLVITNPLLGTVVRVDGLQVIPTVWRLRDRLSPRDLALFLGMAFVGPNYPGPSSYAEIIAQAERAATAAADSPEHWWSLGGTLSRYGAAASVPDWPARAADALDRAIALDSSFTPAVEARLYVAMWTRDLPLTRRLSALLEAPVAAGSADATMLWAAAVTLGDSAAARRWRGRVGESDLNFASKLIKMALHSVEFSLPLDDARWANTTLRREGGSEEVRGQARLGELAVAMAEGRMPSRVALGFGFEAWWEAANLTMQATVEPTFREAALEALNRIEDAEAWPPLRDCHAELWRLGGGDTSTTRASIRRLRAFASREPPPIAEAMWGPLDFRVCPLLLETILEGPPFGTRSGERLEALDALMRTGPRWLVGLSPPAVPVVEANWTIARLREAQGDIPAALAAIRRRENSYYPAYLWNLAAFLRQEGRLAALAGDAAGARRAYDQYLTLRTDPDPLMRPQRDSVIAERAALQPR